MIRRQFLFLAVCLLSHSTALANASKVDLATVLIGAYSSKSNEFASFEQNFSQSTTENSPAEEKDIVVRVELVNQTKHLGDIQQLWDDNELDGPMRNALRSSSNSRWTDYKDAAGKFVIPFVITGQFTAQERRNIQNAMDAIERNTCVKYQQRNNELNYVDIQSKKDEGCYTQVGRLRGRQVVMLEQGWTRSCGVGCTQTYPGCLEYSTVIHELMHKIGLWHEQMRFDRDQYIKVRYENIPTSLHPQFEKVSQQMSSTYGVPYDYRSVMHYDKSSGAKQRGLITMETVQKQFQDVIGTVKDASTGDYQKICSIYECRQCMGRPFNGASATNNNSGSSNGNNSGTSTTTARPNPNRNSRTRCVPASSNCGRGIRRGTALYDRLCCP